jgi:hypothetical protein
MSRVIIIAVTIAAVSLTGGCSKRQIVPITLASVGGATMIGGVVYRATLPEEDSGELFGRTPKQQAVTATLLFAGVALILTGVIWSATAPICNDDADCFMGDVCEKKTSTCVPEPAPQARNLTPPVLLGAPRDHRLPPLDDSRFTLRLAPRSL